MAGAALVVEGVFGVLHLIPAQRSAMVMHEGVSWNYTTVLNILFLIVSAMLLVRFLKTGGPAMLREMGGTAPDPNAEPHRCCIEEAVSMTSTPNGCCHAEASVATAAAPSCCHEPDPVAAPADDGSCCGSNTEDLKPVAEEASCCGMKGEAPKPACCSSNEVEEPAPHGVHRHT
jgi:hypothetical protein